MINISINTFLSYFHSMTFTSIYFWAGFFPVLFLLYWIFKGARVVQNLILLLASFLFYGLWDKRYPVILGCSILITYLGGLLGAAREDTAKRRGHGVRRGIVILTIVLNTAILIFFKYTGFIVLNVSKLVGGGISIPDILLPVGLSFYIFQSLTYLFEILKGGEAEKNPIDYALFVSFFPTIISGPIQKSRDFLPQIKRKKHLSWDTFRVAVLVFMWGAFLKLVMADRLAILVDTVWKSKELTGAYHWVAAAAYSLQIYTDFAGYSYMAMAVSALLGYTIKENFHQPYYATTIRDFWRRWHISLTSFLTEYIYFPLGGSRKGKLKTYRNILIVFLVSGIWHGAAWHFVVWGLLHAVFQMVGRATKGARDFIADHLALKRDSKGFIIYQRIVVFILVTAAWVFFRAPSLGSALSFFMEMGAYNPWVLTGAESLTKMGLDVPNLLLLVFLTLILMGISSLRERGVHAEVILEQNFVTRWVIYIGLFVAIAVFGIYGPAYQASSFIYAGF